VCNTATYNTSNFIKRRWHLRGTSAIGALVILFLAISTSLTQGSPGDELIKFVITYPSISPNGDSIQDSTSIEITVLRPCDTLAVTVEDAITSEVLNTLLSAANPPDTVVFCAGWSGQDSFGVLLDEGSYKMHIMASRNDTIEHYNRTVIVDITAPMIQLDRIEPGIFTPGIAGAAEKVLIYFIVTNFHEGDSTILKVTKPSGTSS
jgi:hypothetical protein